MMKRVKIYLSIFAMAVCLVTGCGSQNESIPSQAPVEENPTVDNSNVEEVNENNVTEDPIQESTGIEDSSQTSDDNNSSEVVDDNDYYGDFREEGGTITYITGVSALEDGTYNATVFAGIETYAQGAGVSYSYCISDSNEEVDCKAAIDYAIKCGSKLIVTSGIHFNSIIGTYQTKYPDISFLMIDGVPADSDGNPIEIELNVHCISFDEHEAGYLAGYITAMDGYTKFGFIGGESVPQVIRYGHGFIQGIEDAAEELGNVQDMEVNYWYSEEFLPSDATYDMATAWYQDDTEVIFACGGSLYESVLASADECDGKMIGVDINQNPVSERIITSAMKGINKAVIVALDDYFAFGGWSEDIAGKEVYYGIEDKCPSLPIEEWRFENVTLNDYWNLYAELRAGNIDVEETIPDISKCSIKVVEFK